ncbi:MAG: sugar ABC transporter ATP-binding protein [Lentisphaeria bacterium]|nr:sugar ABC transporter ATP-binding protein [Lentisphaeria bacterium]
MKNSTVLDVRELECAYGTVKVLSGISFQLEPGTILGIAGENGAGKSTLVKCICGLLKPAAGQIQRQVPAAAIHQEFNLAPDLTVAENIFLGREPECGSMLKKKFMAEKTEQLLDSLGVSITPETLVSALTVAEKQMVEIAKAVGSDSGILIMDEPTTVLTQTETEKLFSLVRALTAQGKAVIYISHKLDEVLSLCSRIMVLRDGAMAGMYNASELTPRLLAEKMVGRELSRIFPDKLPPPAGVPKLEVEHLCARGVNDISFSLHAGEILGVAGLNGAGRSELAETLFGLRKITAGTVRINGKEIRLRSVRDALKNKIAFLTEDRQGSGLLLDFPIDLNMTLAALPEYKKAGFLDFKKIARKALQYIKSFNLKCASPAQAVRHLSGGNQQKAAIAKCLDTAPEIFIFDEPTRGVDVGARREIYDFVHSLAGKGAACLLISSDLEEVLGLCRRIMVIRNGSCAGIVSGEELTEQHIIRKAAGVEK